MAAADKNGPFKGPKFWDQRPTETTLLRAPA
jgi:hypothetical protein